MFLFKQDVAASSVGMFMAAGAYHCGAVIDWGENLTCRSIQSRVGKMAVAAAVYHIWRPRNICKFLKIMFTEEQMVKRIFFLEIKWRLGAFVPKRITAIDSKYMSKIRC